MDMCNVISCHELSNYTHDGEQMSLVLGYPPDSTVTSQFSVPFVKTVIKYANIIGMSVTEDNVFVKINYVTARHIFTKYNFEVSGIITIDGSILEMAHATFKIIKDNMLFNDRVLQVSSYEAPMIKTIECSCCCSEIDSSKIVSCTSEASHKFCYECMNSHFKVLLSTNSIKMNCVDTSACTGLYSENDLSKFMDNDTFIHYFKVKQRIDIKGAIGQNTATCPVCNIEVIDDRPSGDNLFECPNRDCLVRSCSRCRKAYHSNDPCIFEDQERIDQEESETYKVVKTCPGCNVDMFRTEGCNHMTCNCGVESCYLCGEDITGRVSSHPCPVFGDRQSIREDVQSRNDMDRRWRRVTARIDRLEDSSYPQRQYQTVYPESYRRHVLPDPTTTSGYGFNYNEGGYRRPRRSITTEERIRAYR